ncbi:glycosyltransferase [Aeromonas veronii]|uniref:glycosyltransferase n=3 Tax=Aeromonas veronii TaxID=654 RepID=UPI0009B83E94|nr:glycosyltransferase [Aeromonas veronii]
MVSNDYKNKSIAIICLSHYWGGMELDALKLAKSFNIKCKTVLICKDGSELQNYAEAQGIPFRAVNFKTKLSVSLIWSLLNIFKEFYINNAIFLGTSEIKSIFFAKMIFRGRLKLAIRYGTTMGSSKKDPLHRLFYSCVNVHVGISQHIVENIKKIIPVSPSSVITRIYAGTDFLDVKMDGVERKKSIINVSRVVDGKGHKDLIIATKDININVYIVGGGEPEYIAELKSAIPASDVEKYHFTGYLEPTIVKNELWKHGLFVFPSYGEGLGNALVEALGAGLVCITYDNTVFKEFVELGFYIHIIPNGDVKKLNGKIKEILDNYEFELSNARKNIELAREVFSLESEIESYFLAMSVA